METTSEGLGFTWEGFGVRGSPSRVWRIRGGFNFLVAPRPYQLHDHPN